MSYQIQRKSLLRVYVLLCFFVSSQVFSDGGGRSSIQLSRSEQAYVQKNQPLLCLDPDWWPFEMIDNDGRYVGIAAELHAKVWERLGLQVKVFSERHWDEQLKASQSGQCQMLSFVNQSPERGRWLDFTDPLLVDPNVLITREETGYIEDLSSQNGKIMALPRGTSLYEKISRDFPNIRLMPAESEIEALQWVAEKKADMTIRARIVAAYTIKRYGLFNLKINNQLAGYENYFRVGVLKTEPVLRDILNKGIASLTLEERYRIIDRHVEIKMVTGVDYAMVRWMVAIALIIMLTSLYWLRRLRQSNHALRMALEEVQAIEKDQRQFLSMLSHEVRTPLAVIDGAAQVLIQKLGVQHSALPVIGRIRRGASRLLSLLENSLTQDRLSTKQFVMKGESVDIPTLMAGVVEHAELVSEKHPVHLSLASQLEPVWGDPALLRILFNNLLSNAIKFSPVGMPIDISVEQDGEQLVVRVTDQGPGIPVEDQPFIFQRFRRGRNVENVPGAGLGLALVARIVELHGGRVEVAHPEYGGTAFCVCLPNAIQS